MSSRSGTPGLEPIQRERDTIVQGMQGMQGSREMRELDGTAHHSAMMVDLEKVGRLCVCVCV